MFQQPNDFRQESDALFALLKDMTDAELAQPTQFKGWTFENVLGHLHMWNWAADLSINDEPGFVKFNEELMAVAIKVGLRGFEDKWLDGLGGRALLTTWHDFYGPMAARLEKEDPKRRVKWAGPDMSIRSSITARLMETWAHGQEVFDTLGVVRQDGDRIKNIAVLGMNTFGWTYINRGMDVPSSVPHVRLVAPSGEIWEWNEDTHSDLVEGSATEFCQVVTQTRNIADTQLKVAGPIATEWMAMAQCFAGGPEDPPVPGTRLTLSA